MHDVCMMCAYASLSPTLLRPLLAVSLSPTVSGGSTLFPGFDERLKQELVQCDPLWGDMRVVTKASERSGLVWTGASVLASITAAQSYPNFMDTMEYDSAGPA